jgi:hypothetical protein
MYTSKNGNIARKQDKNITPDKVGDRFVDFALKNPYNVEQYVCVLEGASCREVTRSSCLSIYAGSQECHLGPPYCCFCFCLLPPVLDASTSQPLKRDEFLETVKQFKKGDPEAFEGVRYLQCFIRPKGGKWVSYVHTFERNPSGEESHEVKIAPFCPGHGASSGTGAVVSKDVAESTGKYAMAIVSFLENHCGIDVTGLQAEFVMDENSQMWLRRVSKVLTNYEAVKGTSNGSVAKIRGTSRERDGGGSGLSPSKHLAQSQSLPTLSKSGKVMLDAGMDDVLPAGPYDGHFLRGMTPPNPAATEASLPVLSSSR